MDSKTIHIPDSAPNNVVLFRLIVLITFYKNYVMIVFKFYIF